jgi:hypothetical protein
MALRVKVSARAASQIHKAAEWWAENRPAAPGAIRTDIQNARTKAKPYQVRQVLLAIDRLERNHE